MIVIIDYGLGNLASVKNMFRKVGVQDVLISKREADILKADKLLLPGVGAFDAGMQRLEDTGLIPLLNKKVLEQKTPILGICLGMQMLTKNSEEGNRTGLGWIDAEVVKFRPDQSLKLKVPNMGWEYIQVKRENALLNTKSKTRFYFVHSYFVKCNDEKNILATSNFGGDFTCAVNRENIYGTQFHPEKSLSYGMEVLQNFSSL